MTSITCILALIILLVALGCWIPWKADKAMVRDHEAFERRNAEMKRKKDKTKLRGEVERIELENRGLVDVGYHIYRKRIS